MNKEKKKIVLKMPLKFPHLMGTFCTLLGIIDNFIGYFGKNSVKYRNYTGVLIISTISVFYFSFIQCVQL